MPHFPKPFFKKARQQWYVEIDRRQICLGPDQAEAFRRYHALMQKPEVRPVSTTLLVPIVDAFLEWVRTHRSPDTFEWYRYRCERFCQRFPDLKTEELRPFHVQQWVDGYPDLSQTSKRNYIRAVKRCCQWAVQQGYLATNPLQHLEAPGAEHRERLITGDEYQSLLRQIRDEDFRELVIVTWETGCRPQELLRVEARHVDLARQRWVFPKSEAKGKRQPRVVYLSETVAKITQRRMMLFPSGPLFRNTTGVPWTTDAVNCQFGRLRERLLREQQSIDPTRLEAEITRLIPLLKPTRLVKGVEVPKEPWRLKGEARQKVQSRLAREQVPCYSDS